MNRLYLCLAYVPGLSEANEIQRAWIAESKTNAALYIVIVVVLFYWLVVRPAYKNGSRQD